MAIIVLVSWREGLQKVALTKVQVEKLGLSLKESKNNVDSLLDGKEIRIEVKNDILAQEFFKEVEKIGVNGKILME